MPGIGGGNAALWEGAKESVDLRRLGRRSDLALVLTTSLGEKFSTVHLHFYMHNIDSGPNTSAVRVVRAPSFSNSLSFGDGYVFDDPLTEGPNLTSKLVGRAQGTYFRASQGNEIAILVVMNMVFLDGLYSGSTIAIVGRVPLLAPSRELTVVGGTGQFRMARGFLVDKLYKLDNGDGEYISEGDVYITP